MQWGWGWEGICQKPNIFLLFNLSQYNKIWVKFEKNSPKQHRRVGVLAGYFGQSVSIVVKVGLVNPCFYAILVVSPDIEIFHRHAFETESCHKKCMIPICLKLWQKCIFPIFLYLTLFKTWCKVLNLLFYSIFYVHDL